MEAKPPKTVNFINLGNGSCVAWDAPAPWPPLPWPQWLRPTRAELQSHLGQDLLGQGSGPVVGGVALLILGHSMVHQPQSLGLRPTQSSACEDELLRQGRPQASRQPLSPSCQDGVGVVNRHGTWGPRGGTGWESAKTSPRTRLG